MTLIEASKASRTKKRALIAVIALVVAAAIAVAVIALAPSSSSSTASSSSPLQTTVVKKTDLSISQSISATLGFGTARVIKGAGAGIVTQLPTAGQTVARGESLYRANNVPVPVFFGGTPLFRQLGASGLTGPDVAVVADNLAALGFPTGIKTADQNSATWNGKATAALKAWQRAAGLDASGTLDVGQVVIVAGPIRVDSVTAQLGDAASTALVSVTSTTKLVTVPVKATDIGAMKIGEALSIALPNGKNAPGTITAISAATNSPDSGQGSPANTAATLNVTVTPTTPADLAGFDYAQVTVEITTEKHAGVLAVPVQALVALQEGGYALQLPKGGFVAVTTGMFSNSLVEVSGPGITEGLKVVTAS